MDLNRDSFLSEEIINYLQSSFQNIYSDSNIIKNYIRYKELLLKQETSKTAKITNDIYKFTSEDEEELESLNRYFYGNSDGSSSGNGNNIAYTYLSTIQTIKELIDKSDNSIKDVVVNLTSLLSTSNMSDDAYKRYLNELIIPGILGTSEITADKAEITVKLNKDIENQFSTANKNAYIDKVTDEKLKMMTNEQTIKDKKLTDEAKLQEKLQGKLVLDNRIKQAKQTEAQRLKDKNKLALNSEKAEIFKQKKKDINSDIKLKIQKIDEIIKNEIYLGSIKKLLKGRVKSEPEPKNNPKIFRNEEPQIKAKNDDNDDNDDDDDDNDDDDEKVYKATKTQEERNKLEEVIRTLKTSDTSDTSQKDNSDRLKDAFNRLKENTKKKKGGGFKDLEDSEIPEILFEINRITTQTSKLSYNEKTEKLLNLYLRLYTSYINPLKKKLADTANNMSDDDRDNLLEDIILLYNNFKKEYDEFIKQNKEILQSDNIQNTKDTLTNKNSQKKIAENSIEQSILDLFKQYENLAINYNDIEKIIIKKSMKGGASKKIYLKDIIQKLDEYEQIIQDKDKITSLKIKIRNIIISKINNLAYYNHFISFLDNKIKDAQGKIKAADADADAAKKAAGPAAGPAAVSEALVKAAKEAEEKANKLQRSQLYIDKLLKAIAKIKELKTKIKDEEDNEDIFIQLNIELTKAYNQLISVKSNLSLEDNANDINQYIQIFITDDNELKEIYDKFNEIKKLLNSDTQDTSKYEISKKFIEINDFLKNLKTLKYLNKYKYYLDKINKLLDEIKKLLGNLAKNDDNDDANDDNDDNDDMKTKLQEEITDLQEKLNKSKSEIAAKTLKQNEINLKLEKLYKEKETIEQTIARITVNLSHKKEDLAGESEKLKQNTNNIQKFEATKKSLDEEIELYNNIIENTEKDIKSKKRKLDGITRSKEKEIKQKKIAKDLESQREFIRDISNQLKEYAKYINNYEKIITIIKIIKKKLNENIYDIISDKDNFKFIKKKFIKCYIDYYLYLVITAYLNKLKTIEKLSPREQKDKPILQNMQAMYTKEITIYKEKFYKILIDIINYSNNEISDNLEIFLDKNLYPLLTNDDRYDNYQIYLIINLIISLNNNVHANKFKKLVYKILFNSDDEDISTEMSNEGDFIETKYDYTIIDDKLKQIAFNDQIDVILKNLAKDIVKYINGYLTTTSYGTAYNLIAIYIIIGFLYIKNTILHENIDVSNIPDLDADLEIIFEIICNKIQIFRSNSYIQPLTKQIKEIKILFNSKRKFKFLTPNKDKFLISIICFVNGIIAFINRLLLDNYDNIQTLLNKGDDEIQTYITTYFTQNVYDTFNYLNKNWTIAPVFTKIPSLNELHTFIKQFIVVEVVLAGVAGGSLNIINSNKYNENEKIIQNSSISEYIKNIIKNIYEKFYDLKQVLAGPGLAVAGPGPAEKIRVLAEPELGLAEAGLAEAETVKIYAVGGNKDNIIDIKNTYDLYYSTNTDDLIIELLDVLGTNENVIYFLLIINTSLANFFEDLNQILIDFYNSDILLSYYYNDNEIIYYIFLNYIYNNYKSLLSLSLSLSTKDIIINIGKIKTKENYNEIYKKLEELFKNPEIISKLIIFIKSHLKIPETIRHPKKIKDVEYILLFIYKYSKKDEKVIKGYDSFLTYIYLNLLNKFNITSKIKIDDLPTFNLYNFTNLRKTYYFELSSNQDQLCVKLMKDVKLLISIISDRYKYIENKKYIKSINGFVLNDEILDYLNIFETHEIFSDYKQMPIMDLYILNKNSKIDIRDIREPTKQDNIIYNILLLSSFIYKNNNKISVEIYCKLVKHYFLIKNNNKLNDLTYKFIYLMNKRINRLDIQRKLINELSSFNIELSEIKKFVEPEDIKIDILELLEKINLITYLKSNIELMIPYLLEFYKNDNKTQYSIQDLLSKQILTEKPYKLLMYGGTTSSTNTVKSDPIVYEKKTEFINTTFADITIDELEKNNKNINKTINEIKKLSEIETEFNNALKFTIEVDKKKIEITKYDDYMDMNGKFDELSKILIDHCSNKDKETSPQSPESMRYKSLLNNKLIEIEKFKAKIIKTYDNDINAAQTKINKYYEPYLKMIDKIKETTEIQDYPYIKEIYKLYIKVDEEKAKLKYDIDEYFKEYIEQLKELQSYLDDIIEPSNNKGKIPNLIKNLDDLITNNKQQRYNNNNNKNRNGFPDFGGGGRFDKKIVGGEVNITDKINKLEEKLKTRIQEREKKMDTISKNFKKLKENRKIDNDVEKKLATPDLFDKDGNNIFERLINSYEQDINDKTIPPEIANNLFYNKVKQNNLDPEIELDITLNDKLIFIAVVYCIRFGSLLFCEYLIKHNLITDINKSLFYFLVFYYVIFGSLLLIINIDTFKLRILVNYMNLHISTTNIWMHLILMGSFVYLIYLLVMNILGDEKPPTELGDHEKIKLKYKLDLLTIIIYVFICILIFII